MKPDMATKTTLPAASESNNIIMIKNIIAIMLYITIVENVEAKILLCKLCNYIGIC